MTLKIDRFRDASIPLLKRVVERDKHKYDVEELITRVAVATGVHILAIATFYEEVYGKDDTTSDIIKRMMKAYNVEAVV